MTDSDEGLENWQNRLYELQGHRCAKISKSIRSVGSEIRTLPTFDGLANLEEFLEQFLVQVPDSQKMQALASAFRATASRWWNGHKQIIKSLGDCQNFLRLRFIERPQEVQNKYNGRTDPREHLEQCYAAWKNVPHEEWVHRFVHTLESAAKNWYAKAELRHGTLRGVNLADSFILTFAVDDECPSLDAAVRLIHAKVFDDEEVMQYQPNWEKTEANAVECYNLAFDDEDDPRNISIPESEGHCEVHGPKLEMPDVTQPLKTRKINIGSTEEPKFATIGNYWDEEMVSKVTELLHEYQDLFPTKFSEMKGIL